MNALLKHSLGAIALSAVAAAPVHADTYNFSATLTSGPLNGSTELVGTPNWDTAATSLKYDVTYDTVTNLWTYLYTLAVGETDNKTNKDISHMIVELSPDFQTTDLKTGSSTATASGNIAGITIGNQTTNKANPGMPSDLFGIKFDTQQNPTTLAATIVTARAPQWGDFYAKDGKLDGTEVYIYNAGFLTNDNNDGNTLTLQEFRGLTEGTRIKGQILRPDTATVVPIPAAAWLFGSALVGIAGIGYRRKNES